MAVRQDDVVDVGDGPAHARKLLEHPVAVRVVERVDQRQALAVVEEKGVDAATLPLAHAVDPGSDLHA